MTKELTSVTPLSTFKTGASSKRKTFVLIGAMMLMLGAGSQAESNGNFTPEEMIQQLIAEGQSPEYRQQYETGNYTAESQQQMLDILREASAPTSKIAKAAPNTILKNNCATNIQGTNYYTPDSDDFRCGADQVVYLQLPNGNRKEVCNKVVREAGLQGSVVIIDGRERFLLRSTGVISQIPTDKRTQQPCKTSTGGAGTCLVPFIHVAADRAHHSYGDIISVPALKGVSVPTPNGGYITHPGYVVVADTGGAIKGHNRFDFYIGDMKHLSEVNPLGPRGLKLNQKDNCTFGFKKIPTGTTEWKNAAIGIDSMIHLDDRLAHYKEGQQ